MADASHGQIAIHTDLNRLNKWDDRNLMMSKKKCRVLHLGKDNRMQQCMLWFTQLGRIMAKKELGLLVDAELTMSQRCALTTKKVYSTVGCMRQAIANSWGEMILSLYSA